MAKSCGRKHGISQRKKTCKTDPVHNLTSAELSHAYLTLDKFRIIVETRRNRARIGRTRCVPVCGYRAGYAGLGLAYFQAQIWPEIEDFRPDPLKLSRPFCLRRVNVSSEACWALPGRPADMKGGAEYKHIGSYRCRIRNICWIRCLCHRVPVLNE